MKRLKVVMPVSRRKKTMRELTKLGCVEFETVPYDKLDGEDASRLMPVPDRRDAARIHSDFVSALEVLNKYAPYKKSLLTPAREVAEEEMFAEDNIRQAMQISTSIRELSAKINEGLTEESRLNSKIASLTPFTAVDTPLDISGGDTFEVRFGVAPAQSRADEVCKEICADEALAASAELINSDKEQKYIAVIAHKKAYDETLDRLKAVGFSPMFFKDMRGTADDNIRTLTEKVESIEKDREELIEKITAYADKREILEQSVDAMSVETMREQAVNEMLKTEQTLYFEGWVPAKASEKVGETLTDAGCAYEMTEPTEEDDPPVLLSNSRPIAPFSSITELYGLPAYGSMIDPNPFVAVFFVIFFGMMLADACYGLILGIAAMLFVIKAKPQGTMRKFMIVASSVGFSAFVWGAFFGSWFGNFPDALGNMLGKNWHIPPLLFDPLEQPMTILILSLGIGVIHLFIGMGLDGYRRIRQGDVAGAIFDIGFWYLIIGGLLAALLGVRPGIYIALAGAIGVLVTGGRKKKNIFGKITGGLGALYGITSYLSDILSYSRLMALGLASGVVAQVINTMGSLMGSTPPGWILFILVFIIGQVFNLAIGLLGAFVHTCRLQYVEFFGKFFEGGGRAFAPLFNKTKYTRVSNKEDN